MSLDIIRPSTSPWASPLHCVRKPDGSWRPCGDFHTDFVTDDDRYPIRNLEDFNAELAGKRIFSKIGLVKGYHQVPVAMEDVPKTAIITPFGLFEFVRMPFGLKNSAQTFQRLMDSVLRGLPRIYVYLDDILVASENEEQHCRDLTTLFDTLEDNRLIVNKAKCVFGVGSLEFLGHQISDKGVKPAPAKVDAIRHFPSPETAQELRRVLGMIYFFHRFIPHAAAVLTPLCAALRGKSPPKVVEWTPARDAAFHAAKNALADATLLVHPVDGATTALTVDASDDAIGGVRKQIIEGQWRPLVFFSKPLRPREQKYPPFDRELLAAHLAIRHFLEERPFTLFSEHDSLISALHKETEPWNARQTNQLANISEFTTNMRFIEGKANVVADTLSRVQTSASAVSAPPTVLDIFVTTLGSGIDFTAMAQDQKTDIEMQQLRNSRSTSLRLEDVQFGSNSFLCDVSSGVARPIVPSHWRRRVFDAVHGLSHPSVRATRQQLTKKFVWPSVTSDSATWTRSCIACQQSKVQRHVHAPLQSFTTPNKRFQHIHVDVVGPLPPSRGFTYLFTIIDRFTWWPEVIPVSDTEAVRR